MNDKLMLLVMMMPFAAVFCLVVVLLVNRRYERGLMLLAFSTILFIFFVGNAERMRHANIASYMRLALMGACGMAGWLYYLKAKLRGGIRDSPLVYLMLLFLGYALVSTAYSMTGRYTLIRSSSFIIFFGYILGLSIWLKTEDQARRSLNAFVPIVVFLILINLLAPLHPSHPVWWQKMPNRYVGLTDHPNTLGGWCMIAYPVLMWAIHSRRGFWKFAFVMILGINLWLHLLTGSRGTLLTGLLCIPLWLFGMRQWGRLGLTLLLLITLVGVALVVEPARFTRPMEDSPKGHSEITGLTGRPEFWMACLDMISQRPLFGYGYAVEGYVWRFSSYRVEGSSLWEGNPRTSLHQGYLSVGIGLGVGGLLLWLIILFGPLILALRAPASPYRAWVLAVLISALLLNFVETAIASGTSLGDVCFWTGWILAIRLPILQTAGSGVRARGFRHVRAPRPGTVPRPSLPNPGIARSSNPT